MRRRDHLPLGSVNAPLRYGFLLLLSVYIVHVWSYWFLNDDAYISFRYALNWVEMGELSYNLGERVEGYTNFLWVALLSVFYAFGVSIPLMSLILSGLFGIIILLGSAWLARRLVHAEEKELTKDQSFSLTRGFVTLLLLAFSPSFACWTSGGLEVMLFSLTLSCGLALSAYIWASAPSTRSVSWLLGGLAGIILGLSAMTRPEGLMVFGLAGVYRLWTLARARSWLTGGDWAGILGFMCLYLPYYIWRYNYYGYPLPNTYYVKVGSAGFWEPGLHYVGEWIFFHLWLVIPFVYWLSRLFLEKKQEQERSLEEYHLGRVSLICGLALCTHVAKVGGDFMALHRFLVPLLPLGAVLSSRPITIIYRSWRLKMTLKKRVINALAVILLLSAVVLINLDANRVDSRNGIDSIGWLRQFSEQCVQTGQYIQRHTPKDAKLATTAAGALPFYARRYTVDLLGLNDQWIAHHVPAKGQRPGHTKAAPFRYPIDQGVDYLIYHPTFSHHKPRPSIRMKRALTPHGYRWESYQVPGLTPPWWSVWQRSSLSPKKDSSL